MAKDKSIVKGKKIVDELNIDGKVYLVLEDGALVLVSAVLSSDDATKLADAVLGANPEEDEEEDEDSDEEDDDEDDEDSDEDEDDKDDEDSEEDDDEEEEEEDDKSELTGEDLMNMDEEELKELCEEENLAVDPDDFEDDEKGLRKAIAEELDIELPKKKKK